MSNARSAEEAKLHYIEMMGEPLGTIFHALWQEIARLHTTWSQYVELYGTKAERVDILNDTAPLFFRVIQDSLWEQTLLHIARLTDPPSSAGKPNLTIRRLADLIDDQLVANEVRRLVERAWQSCEFCRDWRNRRIAHSELALSVEVGIRPLKPASRDGVNRALQSLTDVLNAVTNHYTQSTTFFEGVNSGSAVNLLYVIHEGLKGREQRRARWKKGEYAEDDFKPCDV
jgi:AbiU2